MAVSPLASIIVTVQRCTNVKARGTSFMFVRKIISMCRTSMTSPIARPQYQAGFLSSNMNFRSSAPIRPARAAAMEQAARV